MKAARSLLKRCRVGLETSSLWKRRIRVLRLKMVVGPEVQVQTGRASRPQVLSVFDGQTLTRIHFWWWYLRRKWLDAYCKVMKGKQHAFRGTFWKFQAHCPAVLFSARITTGESASNDGDDLRLESNWRSTLNDTGSHCFHIVGDGHEPQLLGVLYTHYKGFRH